MIDSRQGSALLAVLWLSAALATIAFTVANSVRGETDRVSTEVDSLRAYYLAEGAVERALIYVEWGGRYYVPPQPVMTFQFPTGDARVELIPENSKLNINQANPTDLSALLIALGTPADRASAIVAGILDWRSTSPGGFTQFDQHYLGLKSSFRARHASFEEIEELLLVQGMTPELFHGRYVRDEEGGLAPVAGLKDCVSVYGAVSGFDANTIEPPLMRAIGISPEAVRGILALRRAGPIKTMNQLAPYQSGGPGFARLSLGPSIFATIRATARVKRPDGQFSDVLRSVSALVAYVGQQVYPPFHVMRWYDNAYAIQ